MKKPPQKCGSKLSVFLCLLFLFPFAASAQNLLVNGGFEEENFCTEYKVNCAPEGWIYTVPSFIYYFRDIRQSHEGSRFIKFIAGHSQKPYYRTFVRTRLLCGLRKGHTYRLRFFIRSTHPVLDSIGIFFTPYDFLFERKPYHQITPSVYLARSIRKLSRRDSTWQEVLLDYKANGNEAFLAIGNFSRRDLTGPTGIERENNFFVWADDFSMVPLDRRENLCADWKVTRDGIYRQDERHEFLARIIKTSVYPPPDVTSTTTQVQKVDTLVIPDVLFATNSYIITRKAAALLDSFIQRVESRSIDSIIVEGHTDIVGSMAWNEELSWRRAEAVGYYLSIGSPLKNFVTVYGYGSLRPVADNRTATGRQRNRRVEIYLFLRD